MTQPDKFAHDANAIDEGKKRVSVLRAILVASIIFFAVMWLAYFATEPHEINFILIGLNVSAACYIIMAFMTLSWLAEKEAGRGSTKFIVTLAIVVVVLLVVLAMSIIGFFLMPIFGVVLYLYLIRLIR
jgi:uncharacterized membrane protein